MILTITDNPNITTIKLDVSKCNKENISIYAKRLVGCITIWFDIITLLLSYLTLPCVLI